MSAHTVKVYVPDEEYVWISADLLSEEPEIGEAEVRIDDNETPYNSQNRKISLRKIGLSSLPLQNSNVVGAGVDDMCTLGYLNEPSILDNLRR